MSRAILAPAALAVAATGLTGCTPRYDWREIHGSDAPYTVLMPVKPASHTRPVNLGGIQVSMTMTAADVDGAMFAVGTAAMPDAAAAADALAAMKAALVRNIGGTVTREKTASVNGTSIVDIEAADSGTPKRLLFAHLVAREARVYQAVAIGSEKSLPRDAVDTFLISFKLN